jgi:phosphoserine aminotransferase
MGRVYNFAAGPAVLPLPVLERAREELLDWGGSGMSVMEMSHRGAEFLSIAQQAERTLRQLLVIPDNYKVLFLQGGASLQFAAVPLNLLGPGGCADYVDTGYWSKKAIAEGRRFSNLQVAASGEGVNYTAIPQQREWRVRDEAAYVHVTPNETIGGVEFHWVPDVGDVALVADMSSTILSRPLDVGRFAVIYAGAQKNIGPAGLTIVIVREDLLGRAAASTPTLLNYQAQANAESMHNTPPTYAWYLAGLVFEWLVREGGLEAVGERNQRKAEKLYAAIDASDFYNNPVERACRSRMNVPFTLGDGALDAEFLREAQQAGLTSLKGHRSVGGMRASLYNAMPEEGVDALIAFMSEFEARRG